MIEILVVVAIIAILAAIIVVGLGSVRRAGRDARRLADVKEIQTGLELYFNHFGRYVNGTGGAATLPTGAGYVAPTVGPTCTGTGGGANWGIVQGTLACSGIGVTAIGDDPGAPSQHYIYDEKDANGTAYYLGALLEDSANPVLVGSVHGTVGQHNMNCATPIYCVASS